MPDWQMEIIRNHAKNIETLLYILIGVALATLALTIWNILKKK